MKYGVRILFTDRNAHTINCVDLPEAQKFLDQIKTALQNAKRAYAMYNASDELVYVCNLNHLIHATVVVATEEVDVQQVGGTPAPENK